MESSNLELVKYMKYLAYLSESFQSVSFNYLPRSEHQFADALAILASVLKMSKGIKLRQIKIETRIQHVYCHNVEVERTAHGFTTSERFKKKMLIQV